MTTFFQRNVLNPAELLLALNTAVMLLLACGLGLLAVWAARRRPAPLQYGLLLSALALVMLAPVLSGAAHWAGAGWFRIEVGPPATPPAQQPSAAPLAFSADRPDTSPSDSAAAVTETTPSAQERSATALPGAEELQSGNRLPPADDTAQAALPAASRAVAAAPRPAVPWWQSMGTALVGIWGLGVVVGLLRLARGCLQLRRVVAALSVRAGTAAQQSAERAARILGVHGTPTVYASSQVPVPLVVGFRRPAIVLPRGLERLLMPKQLDAVLLHETAHVAHHDVWVGLLQRLAAALCWWCPLVYRLNRRLTDVRERICDNYVLQTQGDGFAFAQVLVTLAERVNWLARPRLVGAIGVLEPVRDGLEGRVARLLQKECNTMTRMNLTALLAAAGFGLLLSGTMLLAQVRAADRPAPHETIETPAEGREPGVSGVAVTEDEIPATKLRVQAPPAGKDSASASSPASIVCQASDPNSAAGIASARIGKLRGEATRDEKSPGKPVVGVNLRYSKISDADLVYLQGLTQLRVLNLSHTGVTGDGLEHLQNLAKLRVLNLSHTGVTGNGLQYLQNLRVLDLSHTDITDDRLPNLTRSAQLEVLDLTETKITDNGLAALADLTQLQSLKLVGTQVTGTGHGYLKNGTQTTINGLECLKNLTQLQSLNLDYSQEADTGLVHLRGLTQLQWLYLFGTKVSDAGLVHLQGLTQLRSLDLGITKATDAGLINLQGLTKLQRLDLRGTEVTDAGLTNLRGLTKLQRLDLTATKVTDAGLVNLKGLTKLTRLDLAKTKISDAGLVHLQGLTKLQSLDLKDTQVTLAGLVNLQGLTELRYLTVQGPTDAERDALQKILPACKILGGNGKPQDVSLPEEYTPAAD